MMLLPPYLAEPVAGVQKILLWSIVACVAVLAAKAFFERWIRRKKREMRERESAIDKAKNRRRK
jgi:cytochrome c-type biogenesis protein CcmH/NrfF